MSLRVLLLPAVAFICACGASGRIRDSHGEHNNVLVLTDGVHPEPGEACDQEALIEPSPSSARFITDGVQNLRCNCLDSQWRCVVVDLALRPIDVASLSSVPIYDGPNGWLVAASGESEYTHARQILYSTTDYPYHLSESNEVVVNVPARVPFALIFPQDPQRPTRVVRVKYHDAPVDAEGRVATGGLASVPRTALAESSPSACPWTTASPWTGLGDRGLMLTPSTSVENLMPLARTSNGADFIRRSRETGAVFVVHPFQDEPLAETPSLFSCRDRSSGEIWTGVIGERDSATLTRVESPDAHRLLFFRRRPTTDESVTVQPPATDSPATGVQQQAFAASIGALPPCSEPRGRRVESRWVREDELLEDSAANTAQQFTHAAARLALAIGDRVLLAPSADVDSAIIRSDLGNLRTANPHICRISDDSIRVEWETEYVRQFADPDCSARRDTITYSVMLVVPDGVSVESREVEVTLPPGRNCRPRERPPKPTKTNHIPRREGSDSP